MEKRGMGSFGSGRERKRVGKNNCPFRELLTGKRGHIDAPCREVGNIWKDTHVLNLPKRRMGERLARKHGGPGGAWKSNRNRCLSIYRGTKLSGLLFFFNKTWYTWKYWIVVFTQGWCMWMDIRSWDLKEAINLTSGRKNMKIWKPLWGVFKPAVGDLHQGCPWQKSRQSPCRQQYQRQRDLKKSVEGKLLSIAEFRNVLSREWTIFSVVCREHF